MKPVFGNLIAVLVGALIAVAPVTVAAEQSIATGTFSGASNHLTTGGVQIVKTSDGGAVVILDTDFSLDGGPDPHVGFGVDGTYVDTSDLGDLQKLSGLQFYVVPPTINVDDFNEVYIWCQEVGVPLGVAPLS